MRTLIESKCHDHVRFRYVVANAGRVCCATDDAARMCAECRQVVVAPGKAAPRALGARQAGIATVPPPPDMGALIRKARQAAEAQHPKVRVNAHGVPDAPDLGERIRAARAAR